MVTTDNDAFGTQLLDGYRGVPMTSEILERDDGHIFAGSGFMDYFDEYPCWPESEKQAIAMARGRVLDVGCGAGKHAMYLQSRGVRVTAIDNSPGAVMVCGLRGVQDARLISIDSLVSLGDELYDTILLMGNTLGLVADACEGPRRLRMLANVASQGARLIISCQRSLAFPADLALSHYTEWNRTRGRRHGNLRVRHCYGDLRGNWFDCVLVEPDELAQVFENGCWGMPEVVFASSPYYIAVATAPGNGNSRTHADQDLSTKSATQP